MLSACSLPAPDPAPLVLAITSVQYDCSTKVLTVEGTTAPTTVGLPVQLLVRTAKTKREPVWSRATTVAPGGTFHAVARYLPGAENGATALALRAGTVVEGVRVFSPKVSHAVTCG